MNSQKKRRVLDTPCASDPYHTKVRILNRGMRVGKGGYPMFKSPVSVLFEHFESFRGGFIQMLTLSYFFEDPGFYDCAACNHGGICARLFDRIVKVDIRIHVSVSARQNPNRGEVYPMNAIC